MSYEGYTQYLCPEGHYWVADVYEYKEDICSTCQKKSAWENSVDTTNGSFDPITEKQIDGYVHLEIDKPAQECKCKTCGNNHIMKSGTYKIPKEKKEKGRHEASS